MITLTDMFCGAGGSSTGALDVPGVEVRVATNHWERAIETHNTNHPDADHVCADVSQIDPRYFPHSDMLWASPECTNHSVAKGRKRATQEASLFGLPDEAAERSRATMWDVPRFAEHHDYKLIITENVVDAAKWSMFDAWLHAMDSLGYDHHIVYLNSMHAQTFGLPAPQSRDRMYVMFWKKGNRRPDFERLRPQAWCEHCDQQVTAVQSFKRPEARWGRYRAQYTYRCPNVACRNSIVEPAWLPASSVIDWDEPAQRIGDRARPLAEKTMRRIEAGLRKYAHLFEAMMVNHVSGADRARSVPVSHPMHTLVAGGLHESLLVPVEGREGKGAAVASAPMRTQTTRNETALVVPYYSRGNATTVDHPVPTIPTVDHFAMVYPKGMHLEAAGNTYDSADPSRGGDYWRIWPDTDPLRTMHTTASKAVVIPLRNHNKPKPTSAPLDTIAAAGNHHGLAVAQHAPIAVEDCLFRMLTPHEIKRGMAFPADYVLLGTKRETVRMAGNAVTPPAARDLIRIAVESLMEVA